MEWRTAWNKAGSCQRVSAFPGLFEGRGLTQLQADCADHSLASVLILLPGPSAHLDSWTPGFQHGFFRGTCCLDALGQGWMDQDSQKPPSSFHCHPSELLDFICGQPLALTPIINGK